MIKRIVSLLCLVAAAFILSPLVFTEPPSDDLTPVAEAYLRDGPADLGGQNLVTSVIVTYRGLDTLGEVAVLFAATAAVGLLLKRKSDGSESDEEMGEDERRPASEILETGAGFLFPLILLFGVYIFLHGHLTPGGGFQGGVVLATGFLLLLLSGRARQFNHTVMTLVESLSGAAYVAVALAGVFLAGGFLDPRFLPDGEFGRLFSAGAIPIIYSLVGLKVGAELTGILDRMRRKEGGVS